MGLSKLCHILGFMRLVNSAIVPGPSTSSANASTTISETREELEKLHAVELVGADSEQGRTNVLKVTVLEATEINAFKPYTFYAGAAHCNALVTATWRCGPSCDANPEFTPTASGGDGVFVQFWYVGWDPILEAVIVGYQGTDISKILPVLTDLNLILRPLSPLTFPSTPLGVLAHSGFATAHALSERQVDAAVHKTIERYSAEKVTVVGHSLGAAIAMLSALHLKLTLPSSVDVHFKGYGMPRTGNRHFADFIDDLFGTDGAVQRVANLHDLVPIVPSRVLGYSHTSGEIHITDSNIWNACDGQDNRDPRCTVGYVPSVLVSDFGDHKGPYEGYVMGEGC